MTAVALVVHPNRPRAAEIAVSAAAWLQGRGHSVHMPKDDADAVGLPALGCDDLGEVTHALNPIGAGTMTGPEMADMPGMAIGDAVGSANAVPVEIGRITLAVPLAELVAERQAVNVYRSESEYGVTVACGDVGGATLDDTLAFGLREQNGSGLSGLVVFTGRGEETDVVAYLTSTSGTPAESGTAGETGDVDASDPAAESGRGDRVDRGDRASSADRASRGDRVGRGGATPTAE